MKHVIHSMVVLGLLLATATPAHAEEIGPREYIANGIHTIWCDGTTGTGDHEDDPLVEPWCVPLNALNPGEETEIGGVEWDLEVDDRGRTAVYQTQDDLSSLTFSVLGIKPHTGDFIDPVAGCGVLLYAVPIDAPLDEDGDIDLVGQVSLVQVDDDLQVCLGTTGVAVIDLL